MDNCAPNEPNTSIAYLDALAGVPKHLLIMDQKGLVLNVFDGYDDARLRIADEQIFAKLMEMSARFTREPLTPGALGRYRLLEEDFMAIQYALQRRELPHALD